MFCLPKKSVVQLSKNSFLIDKTFFIRLFYFYQVCDQRGDELAEIVGIRLDGAGVELHGADERYHKNY